MMHCDSKEIFVFFLIPTKYEVFALVHFFLNNFQIDTKIYLFVKVVITLIYLYVFFLNIKLNFSFKIDVEIEVWLINPCQ